MTDVLDAPASPRSQDAKGAATTEKRAESGGGLFWWAMTSGIAVMALVFAFIGLWLPNGEGSGQTGSPAQQLPTEFDIELGDIFVSPNHIEVAVGAPITLHVTNTGAISHDLKLNGVEGLGLLAPGESGTIELAGLNADAEVWCTVPGHQAAGMMLHIAVEGSVAASDPAANTAPVGPASAALDPQAEPSASWMPFDPAVKPAPGGTEHKMDFHATEELIEVAPGVTQKMWTFNGQVPGPILRGKIGDVFTITLFNDGQMDHSIDLHASRVAWNDEMRSIAPGESLVYQFKADLAGMYMYHCGTAPALHHIGNGMHGAIIIDPPELAPVDHEFIIVQSELYFGPQNEPGDLAKMLDAEWDAIVFNGYANQYLLAPIRVETDERIRVWVLDVGPSENSAFHIVGTIFDTVYKEGTYLLQPDDRRGGSQVLDLQPAQGGFVEFSFAEDGLYPIVTHKFVNVGMGALGLFQSGEVEDAPAGGH